MRFKMRKSLILLVGAVFVASLPSIASAKRLRHHPRHVAMAPVADNSGAHFVGDALYQLVVPLQQTFGSRAPVEARHIRRHKRRPG
jgi:hypothetical protein